MNILFIIKVKILMLIKWSYRSLPLCDYWVWNDYNILHNPWGSKYREQFIPSKQSLYLRYISNMIWVKILTNGGYKYTNN